MAYDIKTTALQMPQPDLQGIRHAIQTCQPRQKAKFSQRDFADSLRADIIAVVNSADAKKPRLTGTQIGEIFKNNCGSDLLTDEFVRCVCEIVTAYRKSQKLKRLSKIGGRNSVGANPMVGTSATRQSAHVSIQTPAPATKQAPSFSDVQQVASQSYDSGPFHSGSTSDLLSSVAKLVTFDADGIPKAIFLDRWKRDDEPVANQFFRAIYSQNPYTDALFNLVQDQEAMAKVKAEGGERAQILAEIRAYVGQQQ